LQILERIKPHTAIIFISHKTTIAEQISDRVYLLEEGKLQDLTPQTSDNKSERLLRFMICLL
jgi:ABC-type glutathione transport system ATPase component